MSTPHINNEKMVCTHVVPTFDYNLYSSGYAAYGEKYPYHLLGSGTNQLDRFVNEYAQKGTTHLTIDTLPAFQNGTPAFWQVTNYLLAIDTYNKAKAPALPRLLGSITVDLNGSPYAGNQRDGFILVVNKYIQEVQSLGIQCAAKDTSGKYIVWNYSGTFTADDITYIRSKVIAPIHIIANIQIDLVNSNPTPTQITNCLASMSWADSIFSFNRVTATQYATISTYLLGIGKPWVPPVVMGYYRGYSVPNAFNENINTQGTYFARTQINQILTDSANLEWCLVSTANDMTEATDTTISSTWHDCRHILVQWLAHRFSNAVPFPATSMFQAAPFRLYQDEVGVAETLFFNNAGSDKTISVQTLDASGNPLSTDSLVVHSGTVDAVQVSMTGSTVPSYFQIMSKNLTDGQTLACLCVPVRPTNKPAGYNTTPNYRAVKYGMTLPRPVIDMSAACKAQVEFTTGAVAIMYGDVLHDSNLRKSIHLPPTPFTLDLGIYNGSAQTQPDYFVLKNNLDFHWYEARIIDQTGKIGYSLPVKLS